MAAASLTFSTAHSALYGLIDAADLLVRMMSRRQCTGAALEDLRESRRRAPTADWYLMKVRGVLPADMDGCLRGMISRRVR